MAELNNQATVVLGIFGSDIEKQNVSSRTRFCDGLASGRPVVTRRSPAMSEHFQDGTHVWVPSQRSDGLGQVAARSVLGLGSTQHDRSRRTRWSAGSARLPGAEA